MKSLQSYLATLCVVLATSAALAASLDIPQLLTEGQTAYIRGDLAKAREAFGLVYQMDSRNQVAIAYLRKIKIAQENAPKGNDQEKQLAALIIPQIQFRDATLVSALDYLKKAVEKASDGKQAVNFVVQLPAEQVNTQTVTLSLTNVPFTEALRYVGGLSSFTPVYEKYAITLKPKAPEATATTAPQ
jgi:hypothetical protein